MKKAYLLITLVLIAFGGIKAQNNNLRSNGEKLLAYSFYDGGTGVWLLEDSEIFFYNNLAQDTSILFLYCNGTDTCGNEQRNLYAYDAAGNQALEMLIYWNQNRWVVRDSNIQIYDQNGNQVINALWDFLYASDDYYETYAYDGEHHDTLDVTQVLNADSQWTNFVRNEWQYDDSGNLIRHLDQVWGYNTWVNNQLLQWTIGSYGTPGYEEYQFWDSSANTWINRFRYINIYSSLNYDSIYMIQVWDYANSVWDTESCNLYNYDARGNLISNLKQSWTNSIWQNSSFDSICWNSAGQDTALITIMWGPTTQITKLVRSYNTDNQVLHSQYFSYDTGVWTLGSDTINIYDSYNNITYQRVMLYTSSDLDTIEKFWYYGNVPVTGIEATAGTLGATLYPNPSASGEISMRFSLDNDDAGPVNITLYDEQSRLLATQQRTAPVGVNTVEINYPQLSAGVYFIRLLQPATGNYSVMKWVKE